MNVVFAHDHRFVAASNGSVMSAGKLPYTVLGRYLKVFGSVTVLARLCDCEGVCGERLDLSSGDGVRFIWLPSLSSPGSRIAKYGIAQDAAMRAIGEADAVIARLPSEIGSLAVQCARRLGRPWAIEIVACPWGDCWAYGTLEGKLYAPYSWFRLRTIARRATHALYVTGSVLQRRYPCPGHTVSCSNVEVAEPPTGTLDRRLASISADTSPVVVGLIGSLAGKIKGIDTLLRALAHPELRDRCILKVLGSGDPAPMQRLADDLGLADRAEFCGVLPSGYAVLEWLDRVDVYAQPSRQEGLPRALIEAMSRGLPAVGSNVGGIPELLDASCIHRPGDHTHLTALLMRAVHDARWRMGQAERNFGAAGHYYKDTLDQVRTGFWESFAAHASLQRRESRGS